MSVRLFLNISSTYLGLNIVIYAPHGTGSGGGVSPSASVPGRQRSHKRLAADFPSLQILYGDLEEDYSTR